MGGREGRKGGGREGGREDGLSEDDMDVCGELGLGGRGGNGDDA